MALQSLGEEKAQGLEILKILLFRNPLKCKPKPVTDDPNRSCIVGFVSKTVCRNSIASWGFPDCPISGMTFYNILRAI